MLLDREDRPPRKAITIDALKELLDEFEGECLINTNGVGNLLVWEKQEGEWFTVAYIDIAFDELERF